MELLLNQMGQSKMQIKLAFGSKFDAIQQYKEYTPEEAPEVLQKLAAVIKPSDGFLIVSGEYNHGIPPALKNLLDHFLEEWGFRPSAIACYSAGQFGGVRAAMQLRMTLCELGMCSIPSLFPIAKVQDTFHEDGTPIDQRIDKRVARFLDEFEWYARALKTEKAKGVPY
ncbi:MAG: NADPH-dependent FMN reductase [Gammaproteobacteria bacterium]|nr:NADPH-dependent FMN reductase [Gammaproteobacteria bacterium]